MDIKSAVIAVGISASVGAAQADSHTSGTQADFVFNGIELSISTGFPAAADYAAQFAALAPACDPEVLEFLAEVVGQNAGLLVDARMPNDRAMGFIPGSVSLPFETLNPNNELRDEILKALGARAFEDVFNFSDAQSLVVYDSGPTRHDAELLIGHLLEVGYPAEKILYYRGGMQVWAVLGLTIQE